MIGTYVGGYRGWSEGTVEKVRLRGGGAGAQGSRDWSAMESSECRMCRPTTSVRAKQNDEGCLLVRDSHAESQCGTQVGYWSHGAEQCDFVPCEQSLCFRRGRYLEFQDRGKWCLREAMHQPHTEPSLIPMSGASFSSRIVSHSLYPSIWLAQSCSLESTPLQPHEQSVLGH